MLETFKQFQGKPLPRLATTNKYEKLILSIQNKLDGRVDRSTQYISSRKSCRKQKWLDAIETVHNVDEDDQ